MIIGFMLLYIGYRFQFPILYFVGCWVKILVSALKVILRAYNMGKDNGK